MIKRKLALIILVIVISGFGFILSEIIEDGGFKSGDGKVFQICMLITFAASAITMYSQALKSRLKN